MLYFLSEQASAEEVFAAGGEADLKERLKKVRDQLLKYQQRENILQDRENAVLEKEEAIKEVSIEVTISQTINCILGNVVTFGEPLKMMKVLTEYFM